jgi:hypothetical protein
MSKLNCAKYPNPISQQNELNKFRTFVGEFALFTFSVGTRDINFNTDTVTVSFSIPHPIVAAYIYWNVIGSKKVSKGNKIELGGKVFRGKNVGWCGNTNWTKTGASKPTVKNFKNSNVINKVYRANVTGHIGTGSFDFKILGSKPDPSVAPPIVDSAHFPGCNGSQGVIFVFVYEDPCPSMTNTFGKRKIILYDGAVLINAASLNKPLEGVSSYTLKVKPGSYTQTASLFTGVGDANSHYADSLSWNGHAFHDDVPGSYFNPNAGLLLSGKLETLTGFPVKKKNKLVAASTSDALSWFFAAYVGHSICCAYVPRKTPDKSLKDQMTLYRGFLGNVDYTVGAVGIRDTSTSKIPAQVTVDVPGRVLGAFLYWNVIGQGNWNPFTVKFDGKKTDGCLIGWCGNTCWPDCCQCSGPLPPNPPMFQTTINLVYRADVTSMVSGSGTYSVAIPTQVTSSCIFPGTEPDNPHLPECHSGQGIVLLVVYETSPEVSSKKGCCPGHKSSFIMRKQVLITDGCVLLTPHPQPGPFGGGFPEYAVTVNTQYNTNIKFLTAVGDGQTKLTDELFWDGVPLPQNPYGSYFNPNAGNLLAVNEEVIGGNKPCKCKPVTHTALAQAGTDCLAWFLFVYYGEIKCVNAKVISPSQRIRASGCPNG